MCGIFFNIKLQASLLVYISGTARVPLTHCACHLNRFCISKASRYGFPVVANFLDRLLCGRFQ